MDRCAVAVRSPPLRRPDSIGSATVHVLPGATVDSRTRSLPSSSGLLFRNGVRRLTDAICSPSPLHNQPREVQHHTASKAVSHGPITRVMQLQKYHTSKLMVIHTS